MTFERIIGKKSEILSEEALITFIEGYPSCHIDLGTGDGAFVWRLAKKESEKAVIGLDAAREPLREISAKSLKKVAKGGTPNARFFCANVLEELEKDVWHNRADSVSINFPWGSLLQAITYPYKNFLPLIHHMLKEEGTLELHINMYVFGDETQRKTLGLPDLTEAYLTQTLIPAYKEAGFYLLEQTYQSAGIKTKVHSTWGSRLTRRSKRPTLVLLFKKDI